MLLREQGLNTCFWQVEVAPCNAKGKEYTEADDKFVDAPDELVGKEVNFVFKIVNCRGIPNKYTVSKFDNTEKSFEKYENF